MLYALASVAVLGAAPLSPLMDLARVLRSFVRSGGRAGGFTCAMLSNEQQPFLLCSPRNQNSRDSFPWDACTRKSLNFSYHGNRED